jgi:hypothetical protein
MPFAMYSPHIQPVMNHFMTTDTTTNILPNDNVISILVYRVNHLPALQCPVGAPIMVKIYPPHKIKIIVDDSLFRPE